MPPKPSSKDFLRSVGAKTHLSDDEDYQFDRKRLKRRTIRNNYFAQKRILDHEIDNHSLIMEKFTQSLTESLRSKFEKHMQAIRALDIQKSLDNLGKCSKLPTQQRRFKAHSLDTKRDSDYYYNDHYISLLKKSKQTVSVFAG